MSEDIIISLLVFSFVYGCMPKISSMTQMDKCICLEGILGWKLYQVPKMWFIGTKHDIK